MIQLQQIPMIEKYSKIVNVINLEEFDKMLQIIKETTNTELLDNFSKQLIGQIENKLYILEPHTAIRNKRGLINGFGTLLKWIGGSMDDNDRVEIERHFKVTENNLEILANHYNQHIKINSQIDENLKTLSQHINKSQKEILEKINTLAHKVEKIDKELHEFKYIQQTKENLQSILNSLEKIEDTILFSKLEILSKDILTPTEIKEYSINTEKLKNIRIAVAQHEKIILIVLQIPIFTVEKYFLTTIIPIPNRDKLELKTEYTHVITCRNEIYMNTEKNSKQKLLPITDNCISQLMNNPNNCTMKQNVSETIIPVTEEIIVTKNLEETKLIQNCNDQDLIIKDHNIIRFTNCKIRIKGNIFKNQIKYVEHNVILPHIIKNISYQKENNLTLEYVHSKHLENLKEIKLLKHEYQNNFWLSLHSDILILLTVGILALILYYYCKQNNNKTKVQITINEEKNEETRDHEDAIPLKEGRVITTSNDEPNKDTRPHTLYVSNNRPIF